MLFGKNVKNELTVSLRCIARIDAVTLEKAKWVVQNTCLLINDCAEESLNLTKLVEQAKELSRQYRCQYLQEGLGIVIFQKVEKMRKTAEGKDHVVRRVMRLVDGALPPSRTPFGARDAADVADRHLEELEWRNSVGERERI